MTASVDPYSRTVHQLIETCSGSEQGFREAAAVIEDTNLKRLFAIYAQQRGRFAEELRRVAPLASSSEKCSELFGELTPEALLANCLLREARVLNSYRRALAERALPTKARFLVSAQLALLEKVYSRMRTLTSQPAAGFQEQRIAL